MGEIINLRKLRKAKVRAEAAAVADANRLRHGRTAGQREREALEALKAQRTLDGAKQEQN